MLQAGVTTFALLLERSLLILAIGYLAPLPPRTSAKEEVAS